MSNIVEQLKALVNDGTELPFEDIMTVEQAASEITRLQAELSSLEDRIEREENTLLRYLAEIRQKSGVGMKPMLSELADAIKAEIDSLKACEGTDTDTRPRYSMKRMRDEIAKAKAYAKAEALEEAARYHDEQAQQIAVLAAQNKHHHVLYDKLTADVITHQRHAAAIRRLKEGA